VTPARRIPTVGGRPCRDRAGARLRSNAATVAPILLGVGILAGAWELIGHFELLGRSWPPMSEVVGLLADGQRSGVIRRAAWPTARGALVGLLVGSGVGLALGLASALVRRLRPGIEILSTSIQAIPIIAFAPVLIVTVGRQNAPIYSAAIVALYPMWVAVSAALLHAPDTYADLSITTGARRSRALRWIFLPHAVPDAIDGLRLAAPAAVIGAIIGEWFGAERGLGVVIIASVLNNQIVQLWATAVIGAALSLVLYGAATGLHREVTRRRLL